MLYTCACGAQTSSDLKTITTTLPTFNTKLRTSNTSTTPQLSLLTEVAWAGPRQISTSSGEPSRNLQLYISLLLELLHLSVQPCQVSCVFRIRHSYTHHLSYLISKMSATDEGYQIALQEAKIGQAEGGLSSACVHTTLYIVLTCVARKVYLWVPALLARTERY